MRTVGDVGLGGGSGLVETVIARPGTARRGSGRPRPGAPRAGGDAAMAAWSGCRAFGDLGVGDQRAGVGSSTRPGEDRSERVVVDGSSPCDLTVTTQGQ